MKQRTCVQTFDALGRQDICGSSQTVRAGEPPVAGMPEDQMPVVLVEFIEIESFTGSFAHGAISQFTAAADFEQQIGDFVRGRDDNLKLAAGTQNGLRTQTLYLNRDGFVRNGCGRRLRTRLRKGVRSSGPIQEQVGTGAHVIRGGFGVGIAFESHRWNGSADTHLNSMTAFLDKFARQV